MNTPETLPGDFHSTELPPNVPALSLDPVEPPPPPTTVELPAAANTTVRVRIEQDTETGSILVTGIDQREIPRNAVIWALLPKKYQSFARSSQSYYTLQQMIHNTRLTIPFQVWADTIGQAILHARAQAAGATFESRGMDSAHVILNDQIYKLVPTAVVSGAKVLSAARKLARENLAAKVAEIEAAARVTAQGLISDGQRMRNEGAQVLALARREAANQPSTPPAWAVQSRTPVRFQGGLWAVQCAIPFRILHFDISFFSDRLQQNSSYSWDALPVDQTTIRLWVPLSSDGSYVIGSIMVDDFDPVLPHVNHNHACFTLGDNPPYVRSALDLTHLQMSITRAFSRVQLDSLRTPANEWIETFRSSIPEDLFKELARGWEHARQYARVIDAELTTVPEPEGGSWTVQLAQTR